MPDLLDKYSLSLAHQSGQLTQDKYARNKSKVCLESVKK